MARKKKKFVHNNDRSTWQNEAKEQPYLMPGTVEYQEYQEDLKMHDPFRPDDEWHNEQEQQNENHSEILMAKAEESQKVDNGKRKYMNYMAKEARFKTAKSVAEKAAAKTESTEDDEKVKRMRFKDTESLAYNDGVTPDDYIQEAVDEFV